MAQRVSLRPVQEGRQLQQPGAKREVSAAAFDIFSVIGQQRAIPQKDVFTGEMTQSTIIPVRIMYTINSVNQIVKSGHNALQFRKNSLRNALFGR
jgi:hypothetical protein